MSEPARPITRASSVSVGLMVVVAALFIGTGKIALDVRDEVSHTAAKLDAVAEDVAEIKAAIGKDGALLQSHHAKLAELEARIRALEAKL